MAEMPQINRPMGGDILLVDDQPDVISSIRRVLEFEGYQVRSATNVEEALKLAGERLPGLLLTDIIMPGRSGIELAGELKKLSPELPIVFMRGYADVQAVLDVNVLGARPKFLGLPVSLDEPPVDAQP